MDNGYLYGQTARTSHQHSPTKRSYHIPATTRRIHPESVTFGSIPAKRLAEFEDNEMPAENPKLQHESRWVPERTASSPTELATILAQGCINTFDMYPSADSYNFNFSPKKQVDQQLYVYHVGV